MDIFLIIVAILLMLISIAGCVLPLLPGPPLTYIGLLLLHFTKGYQFSNKFLIIMLAVAIGVTIIDNVIPIIGAKKYGGSKKAVWGSIIGLIVGMFFLPPWGIIIGPFAGAVIGELIEGKDASNALKSGFGTFAGFMGGIILKLIASGLMIFYFFKELI